jgi:4,5-DOPA dioxygenase extradiol
VPARIPPIFISHGAPTSAVDRGVGGDLAEWAAALPRPLGILVVSAHWRTSTLTRGSTAARPPLIYDVDGYNGPTNELMKVRYPAPGASDLAYDVAMLVPFERSERGWDHGVWAPLVHMYPNADIPVLQLSLVAGATPRTLFRLGQRLAPLAARGYLIVGSGGLTHNLAEVDRRVDAAPPEWAKAFDAWAANLLADAEMEELFAWRRSGPEARRAHPTSEHIDPLFVAAGAASAYEHAVGFPIRGFAHGSLSRRSVQFGR